MSATHLVDTSALARIDRPTIEERLEPMIAEGAVATCSLVVLEMLFSTRSGSEHRTLRTELELPLPRVDLDQEVFDRALVVQGLLAERSQHRGVSTPDLAIAAAAEGAGLTVLHYDRDFDRIATVTGQPVEWVVPAGSAD